MNEYNERRYKNVDGKWIYKPKTGMKLRQMQLEGILKDAALTETKEQYRERRSNRQPVALPKPYHFVDYDGVRYFFRKTEYNTSRVRIALNIIKELRNDGV